jgi:hypothetical protein
MSYNWPSKLTASGLVSDVQAKLDAIIDMFDLAVEPANNKILKYNTTTNKFEKATEQSGSGSTQQVCVIANKSAVLSVASQNTPVQIIFDHELADTDSAYNTSTGTFTCPTDGDGAYLVRAKVTMAGLSSGNQYNLSIRQNGSNSSGIQEQQDIFHGSSSQTVEKILLIDAGDTINIWISQETGGAKNTGQDTNCAFELVRVSAFDVS